MKMIVNNVVKQAIGFVEYIYKDGSIVTKEEIVGEEINGEATASLSMSIGLTKNLGNYESVKVTVGLTVPCIPTEEDIEASYAQVKDWVDTKISAINDEIESSITK